MKYLTVTKPSTHSFVHSYGANLSSLDLSLSLSRCLALRHKKSGNFFSSRSFPYSLPSLPIPDAERRETSFGHPPLSCQRRVLPLSKLASHCHCEWEENLHSFCIYMFRSSSSDVIFCVHRYLHYTCKKERVLVSKNTPSTAH